MPRTPGTRVWAIRNADAETIYAYGFGTYVGDHPRPGWVVDAEDRAIVEASIRRTDANPLDLTGYFARKVDAGEMTREEADRRLAREAERQAAEQARPFDERVDDILRGMALNPKIVLDDGRGVVWGCECWWGAADDDTPQRWAKGRSIVLVPAPHPAESPEVTA